MVEIKFKLERYRQDLGDQLVGQLDVLTVAEYLDSFSNNAYTKHRGLLIQIFSFAVAKGLAERNVAELTLIKKEAEKKRQCHTDLVEACHTPGSGQLEAVSSPRWGTEIAEIFPSLGTPKVTSVKTSVSVHTEWGHSTSEEKY